MRPAREGLVHPERRLRIGGDRVRVGAERMLVESAVDMDDWQVRRYRKPLIHFDSRPWELRRKLRGEDGRVRYELVPWSTGPLDLPAYEIRYDEDYVARRDAVAARSRRRAVVSPLLVLLSPLIGLLGSRTKQYLEAEYGINAVTATERSLFLEYLVVIASIAFLAIAAMVRALSSQFPLPTTPLVVAAVVLLPDAIVRYDRVLREETYPPGLYQWLWRRRAR